MVSYTVEQRNYGIVVDAGSSSSKIHLFQWPLHDGDPDKLLTIKPVVDELGDPRIKKVEPGKPVKLVYPTQTRFMLWTTTL